jgi:hypothetical protein
VLILGQKNLKTEHQTDCQNNESKAMGRLIASLNNKLLLLNLKLCDRKDYMETLDKENLCTQNYYMNILKVSTMTENPLFTASSGQKQAYVVHNYSSLYGSTA